MCLNSGFGDQGDFDMEATASFQTLSAQENIRSNRFNVHQSPGFEVRPHYLRCCVCKQIHISTDCGERKCGMSARLFDTDMSRVGIQSVKLHCRA